MTALSYINQSLVYGESMTISQVAGYLLEEVLAHMLSRNGYRLLEQTDDPTALVLGGNGLRVKGRGADHQADALGDLDISIPFTLPIRLFVEAKCVTKTTGLDVVRNALGVVDDVNQRDFVVLPGSGAILKRVQYRYAIFSTGGFSEEAQAYAVAHQISLIDLTGQPWSDLYPLLRTAAREVDKIGSLDDATVSATSRRYLRDALRGKNSRAKRNLLPADSSDQAGRYDAWAKKYARMLAQSAAGQTELFLGFVEAPFILALRPEDISLFVEYVRSSPGYIDVDIRFSSRSALVGDWVVTPKAHPSAFTLTFPLPALLVDTIEANGVSGQRRLALAAKQQYLSSVTVFVEGVPVRLRYSRTGI